MTKRVIGDVAYISAVIDGEDAVQYSISLAGSVFAHDPARDADGKGLLLRIRGCVYRSVGGVQSGFTPTASQIAISYLGGNTVWHPTVGSGAFTWAAKDGTDYAAEGSPTAIVCTLTVSGKEVASEGLQVTEYGNAGDPGKADLIESEQAWYIRTEDTTSPVPVRGTPWVQAHLDPTQSQPYVWECIWTRWSVSGWKGGTPTLKHLYQPQIRILSSAEWSEGVNAPAAPFYRGAPGEPFRDLYLDPGSGAFWECIQSGTMTEVNNPVTGIETVKAQYWKAGTYWPSFGTSLLAAIHAYIDDLVVRRLETVRSGDGLSVMITDGMITVLHAASGQKALFGIDSQGSLTLQFWQNDTLLIGFGPSEVLENFSETNSTKESVTMNRSATDRSTMHKIPVNLAMTTYYYFTEGCKRVQASGVYSRQYKVSGTGTPSVFSGKYIRGSYTDAQLKTYLGSPESVLVEDGYYADAFNTQVADSQGNLANYELRQRHIVGGAVVETVWIGYDKVGNYGIPIYTHFTAGVAMPSQEA